MALTRMAGRRRWLLCGRRPSVQSPTGERPGASSVPGTGTSTSSGDVLGDATLVAGSAQSAPVIVAHLGNGSDQPVYDLTFSWHHGTAPYRMGNAMRPVMPGDGAVARCALPGDLPDYVNPEVFGAGAFFWDAAGDLASAS